MNFDLRFPIGMLFSVYGLLLVIVGVTSSSAIYDRSLGININLDWGIVMLLFGLLMFCLAWRGRSRS